MNVEPTTISMSQPLDGLTASELRGLVERYRRIFCGSGYGFWEWDLDTHSIDWSGGFWESIGYDDEDRKRLTDARELPAFIHPDDVEQMFESVREHLRSAEPLYTCYRVMTKDGDYIWTQVRADSIRDETGRAKYLSGVNFDISELKDVEAALRESEARQARIIQASNDGIWEWYADRNAFHFSSRCWEHLGYSQEDDMMVGGEDRMRRWRNHIYPQDLPLFDRALERHLTLQEPFDIEYRVTAKDGEIRWIRARGKASFDFDGKPTRMSGTNMDITHIKRAEERVLRAKVQAEKANSAKSEFLSSMSHELRTPLNAILGYAQLFEFDNNLKDVQKDNIHEIRAAGEHLLKLINDVLDLAKIESGAVKANLQSVLVSRLLEDCATLIRPQADARGLVLRMNFHGLEDVCVEADQVRLKQALLNLMSNAVKYNKVGGQIDVSLHEAPGRQLRVMVSDTGTGIEESRRAEVFQPFNRLHAEMSKIEGSGVGLVITKQLIESMNGQIDFSSEPGQGTRFWIDLRQTERTHVAPPVAEVSSPAGEPVELCVAGAQRVLYIEDNATNIKLLQHFFSRYQNFSLEIAEEPFWGIYRARQMRPDVIILDVNLPGLDGYEVLKVLQNDPATRAIPVIGLSANVMSIDLEKGREAGFYEYLTKPLQVNRLVATLNQLLGGAREQVQA
ncbi:PAS domain-containing protein [Gilvimarinus xylanilyticus]|uniref:histidine kinase n=1 Tax=Gilvimarinus xylanilyticus TaxID=2944139 RepID=A0A9X2KW87_9GAMM|nr:PAS domain-containing protein [Gilvimarinus xylanilyticus]MCP8898740.1 PAS domain-containing protein [Gilvimarinus xylanilyticus]